MILRRAYPAALWASVVFALVGLFDGFLKIALMHEGPAINYWFFDIAKWLVLPLLLMWAVHRTPHLRAADYGLSLPLGGKDLLIMLPLVGLSLFAIDWSVEHFFYGFWRNTEEHFSNREALASMGALWPIVNVYYSATAGLWESLFFIGLPWLWISQGNPVSARLTFWFKMVSALVFALGHWENGVANVIAGFAFQWLAIWWYLRLKTLWPVIIAHSLIDLYYFWP